MEALMVLFSFPNCRSDLLELLSVHNVGFMAFPDFIFSLPTTIFFSFLVFFTFLFFSITSNIVCLNFSEGGSRDFQCFCKKRPLSRETWQIFRSALTEIVVNYIRGYADNISERPKSKKDKKRKKNLLLTCIRWSNWLKIIQTFFAFWTNVNESSCLR